MENVVIDACVVVKWFIEEPHYEDALKLRDMHVNGEILLVSPSILPYEVANVLKYSGAFSSDEIKLAIDALTGYGIKMFPFRGQLAREAINIAIEKDVTIYDASYVALSKILRAKMYTADEKLIKKLGSEYQGSVLHISQIP